jgi:Lipocalin-like domain
MAHSESFDLTPLVGSWRMVSNRVTFSDTGETIDQFGPDPPGWMVFEPGGRVMFLFTRAGRQPAASDSGRSDLLKSMAAYTGRVHRDAIDRFVISVDLAWNPALSGDQVRYFEVVGDDLNIWSPEQTFPLFGDRRLVVRVLWKRERS